MVCTSMRNFVHNIVHYPFIKWCGGVGCSSVLSKDVANQIGNQTHESHDIKITTEYAIIVHLPDPSLLGCEGRQETVEHCR